MLRAAAAGAIEVTDVRPGDLIYLWEPIFHIGGAKVLLLPLYADVALALTRRFSASRFWSEVRQAGAIHIHYLGGALQILPRRRARSSRGSPSRWRTRVRPADGRLSGDEEATTESREDEWFRTGDHGQWDADGNLQFQGRAIDSARVGGENISAWQVEDEFARHPEVDRCAVIGVTADR